MVEGDQVLFLAPATARILVRGGREIEFEMEDGADELDVALFLAGTALGIVLQQRGLCVLHGASVVHRRHAVLVCGRSGAGKSTLAAALMGRGYPVIGDDVAVIAIGADGMPRLQPDNRDLKLWSDASAGLDIDDRRGRELRSRSGKFYFAPSSGTQSDALPLRAIYVLAPSESNRVTPIPAIDAAARLRQNAYRPRLVTLMEQEPLFFSQLAAILNKVPVFELLIARGWDRLPVALNALEAHFESLGS